MSSVARAPDPSTAGPGSPLRRLGRSFAAGPAAVTGLFALVVMIVWAATEAGQPTNDWYPGALVIVALLVLAATTLPLRIREVPKPVLVAAGCLLAFTLWSFLSIAWADSNGVAWDGANRTLLYFVVFLLFGLWPQRSGAATALLGVWIFALSIVAAVVLFKTGTSDGLAMFREGRLNEPAGYANATAALFLMPAWAALILAGRRELVWVLRGLLGGAGTLLAGVALMALSRGAVFSTPVMLMLVFVAVPGRARTFAALFPIALGVAACTPAVLHANDQLRAHHTAGALDSLLPTIAVAAVVVGVVIGAGAFADSRVRRAPLRSTGHRVISAAAVITLVGVLVAALVVAGNPVQRAQDGWDSFKQGYSNQPGQPLTQGLGSGRYDYYRVSLDLFGSHPLAGVGADNFEQDYLAARKTDETPRYPHSIEMRTLAQTGVVGALLLVGFIAAALVAALRAMRRVGPLGRPAAAAACAAFVYWLAHGSFDWFWEFAGLGAPAFAMIGLACGLCPRATPAPTGEPERQLLPRVAVIAGLVVAVLSMALPWLSDVSTQYAAEHWRSDPASAFRRLERASSLDPLSADPSLVSGTIAVQRSELARAQRDFRQALEREPRSAFATVELAAIASSYGRRAESERLLARAVKLDPRDRLTRKALADARAGREVSIDALNQAMLDRSRSIR